MAYTAERPNRVPTEDLRSRIPGWGVDLDVKNRPAVPRENFDIQNTGAHWTFPERQLARYPRQLEMSTEHRILPPVFGTACPPHGVSGAIRRLAFRYSEGRAAHWLLLLLADRVDVFENGLASLLRARPEVPYLETGMRAQIRHSGIRSRWGQHRSNADLASLAVRGLLVAGTVYGLSRVMRGGGAAGLGRGRRDDGPGRRSSRLTRRSAATPRGRYEAPERWAAAPSPPRAAHR